MWCVRVKPAGLCFSKKRWMPTATIRFDTILYKINRRNSVWFACAQESHSPGGKLRNGCPRNRYSKNGWQLEDCALLSREVFSDAARPIQKLQVGSSINPLNPALNPICYLLALLGAHHFLHVSRIRVKSLTFRRLMSYIYAAPILDVSRSHTTTQHSR